MEPLSLSIAFDHLMEIFGWGSLTFPCLDGDVTYVMDFLTT
jgi:hypothetical protein